MIWWTIKGVERKNDVGSRSSRVEVGVLLIERIKEMLAQAPPEWF